MKELSHGNMEKKFFAKIYFIDFLILYEWSKISKTSYFEEHEKFLF